MWAINFRGLYPVGATAIVATYDNQNASRAHELFVQTWRDAYPTHDPEPVEIKLISVEPGDVHILSNGDY